MPSLPWALSLRGQRSGMWLAHPPTREGPPHTWHRLLPLESQTCPLAQLAQAPGCRLPCPALPGRSPGRSHCPRRRGHHGQLRGGAAPPALPELARQVLARPQVQARLLRAQWPLRQQRVPGGGECRAPAEAAHTWPWCWQRLVSRASVVGRLGSVPGCRLFQPGGCCRLDPRGWPGAAWFSLSTAASAQELGLWREVVKSTGPRGNASRGDRAVSSGLTLE